MEYLVIIFVGAAAVHVIQLFCYFDYLGTRANNQTPHPESGMELHHRS